jgi:hypothetical protein
VTPPIWARLFAPIDIAILVYFRIGFGLLMLWELQHEFNHRLIERYFIVPKLHFTYYGFGWVQPWPGDGMYWHVWALAALALFITVGLWYRVSTALFFLGFSYLFLLDQTRYLNHHYVICLISLLMIFVPAHRAFSLDAWLRPRIRSTWAPAWSLWLLRFQIGVVYFYGGIAKINGDWLRGEPLRGWLPMHTDFPLIGRFFDDPLAALFFSYSGLIIDLFIVPCLLWGPTRVPAFMIAVMFNLMNSALWTIGVFPWLMIAGSALFFPPDWPRRLVARWRPVAPSEPLPPSEAPMSLTPQRLATISLLCLYAAWQTLVPFRHFLYPGNVHWTEEGHRFAWHMMLRAKTPTARFFVTDPASRTTYEARLSEFLIPPQIVTMGMRPDMILQFAHYLADNWSERTGRRPEVRALVIVSLNGRQPQVMIDPATDLAAQPRTLAPARWILPLGDPQAIALATRQTGAARTLPPVGEALSE